MKDTYSQQMRCDNCGDTYAQEFPRGSRAEGYYKCRNCGCRDAMSVGLPEREAGNGPKYL